MDRILRKTLVTGSFEGVTEARSRAMRAVRGRNNQTTEGQLRMALVRAGVAGWTLHAHAVVGRPDFLFPKKRLAVFTDGCFWHGCPSCGHLPKTNASYWRMKIDLNRQRDIETTKRLQADGYRVLRLWEHQIVTDAHLCVVKVKQFLDQRKHRSLRGVRATRRSSEEFCGL